MITGNVALILAGQGSCLEGMECPRVLIPISGEPLLVRTWDQLQKFDVLPMVVTPHRPIYSLFPHCFIPKHSATGPETLLSTRPIWGDRTYVLMGDVIYADSVMNTIMADENILSVYGSKDEIVGIVFSKKRTLRVETALQGTWTHKPWLWAFYRLLCGVGVSNHQFDDAIYYHIPEEGYTRDIDTIVQYRKFLEEYPWARS